ncbi:hypothetical protein MVI01_09770 [Myxococcus virescens]|uniref:Uncharacterized protein n=1 Tax=Myxococcus virescens TaxID=83456 RepID=A0A511H6S8_9BACT|nr:hypothetical protein MVI01_09770 [Myxococcus virescens]
MFESTGAAGAPVACPSGEGAAGAFFFSQATTARARVASSIRGRRIGKVPPGDGGVTLSLSPPPSNQRRFREGFKLQCGLKRS